MLNRILVAAMTSAVLASSPMAHASFFMSLVPSSVPAPAGKTALDLYAQNDLDPFDGQNMLGASLVFAGSGGTKVVFATTPNEDGTYAANVYNYGGGTSLANVADVGGSNFRIGTRTLSQHIYPANPNSMTAAEATGGLAAFQLDYVVLGTGNTVPAFTAPGVQVARLVFNTTSPAFTLTARFAGEVGPVGNGITPVSLVVVAPEPTSLAIVGATLLGVRRRRG